MKRILSVLLALVMVLGMIPMSILTASAAEGDTATYTFSSYSAGKQYAEGEEHTLDNTVTLIINKAHLNTQVRLYANSNAVLASKQPITKVVLNAGYKVGTLTISTSANGTDWTDVKTISTTTNYTDYTIDIAGGAQYVKMAATGAQIRVTKATLTFGEGACSHANASDVPAQDATCTAVGYTAGKYCPDCDTYFTGHTVIPMISHTFENGECSVCHLKSLAGKYYIAAKRSSGNFYYMTNSLGTASTKRYQAVDSGLTALPETITNAETDCLFRVILNDKGTYYIVAEGTATNNYLGWSSGNSGLLVAEASALQLTIDKNANGSYKIYNGSRVLALNNTSGNNYFAFYEGTQAMDMYLIPVVACQHTNQTTTTVDATCETAGSETVTCADCGFVISTKELAATGHDYEAVVTDPTCTEGGYTTHTCGNCGNSYTDTETEATGHNYVNGICPDCGAEEDCTHENQTTTTVDATCTEDGSVTVTCDKCGEVLKTDVITATGHDYETVVTDPTCTEGGYTTHTCGNCGNSYTDTETEATGHDFVDGVCSECGEKAAVSYKIVTADTVVAGNYIIFGTKNDITKRYPATATVSGDWNVSGTAVTINGEVVKSTDLPADAAVFTLTGSKETGFSIGVLVGDTMQYVGYTNITESRKLALSADYSTILWKVVTDDDGGLAFTTTDANGNKYAISQGNTTAATSLRGYKGGTLYNGIYLYRQLGADECVHEVESWNETPATCTDAGSKTGTCTVCNKTVTEEIPALGHAYSYNAETGMMVCANCGDSFMNTIAEAKAYTDGNQIYYIKGIVTYVSGQTVYMQDATGAICVYFTDAENAANIAVGDELLVMDTLTTYKGLIETTYTKSTEIQILSNGNELPVQEVTIAELNADTTNEYLGERVVIKGVTLGAINTSGNTTITDAEGKSTVIRYMPAIDGIVAGDTVDLTAVVSIYNSSYQLYVNPSTAAQDVVKCFTEPTIELTHVSLDPAKDALGFKAAISGDLPAGAQVGIKLSVEGGLEKTYLVDIAELKTTGVFTLRLNGIMAANGGEKKITGTPVIMIGEEAITGTPNTTSMKQTIIDVNAAWDTFKATQQAAVKELYNDYAVIMAAWLGADNKIVPPVAEAPAA